MTTKQHDASTYGTSQKTLAAYIIGFVLCVILTIIPFWLVMFHVFPNTMLYITVTLFAVLQLFVQVRFFLRLNASPQGRWNLMSFLFTILIVLILVFGSLWIMVNLNYYMVH